MPTLTDMLRRQGSLGRFYHSAQSLPLGRVTAANISADGVAASVASAGNIAQLILLDPRRQTNEQFGPAPATDGVRYIPVFSGEQPIAMRLYEQTIVYPQ